MSFTTTIDNKFTVTSVDFNATAGELLSNQQASVNLTLVPLAGYELDAADFSYNVNDLPTGASSISFAQSGDNVIATVNFDTGYVMPSQDIELPICISGTATLIAFNLSGNIVINSDANITPSSGSIAFSASGNDGDQVVAFTQTITANSGYSLDPLPAGTLSQGDPSKYNIVTSSTKDLEGNVVSYTFTGNYTFGPSDDNNNIFDILATSHLIYVQPVEITSYSINTSNISSDGTANLRTRAMTIFGTPGATFTLTVLDNSNDTPQGVPSGVQTIPSSGSYPFNIIFPEVSSPEEYDFVLTGDGVNDNFDGTGQQPSTFTLYQYPDINVVFGLNSVNSSLNISSDVSYTYPADTLLDSSSSNYNFQAVFTILSGSDMTLNSTPTINDWPNLVAASNGGTDIQLSSVVSDLSNNLTYTLTINGVTNETGIQNVLSEIDIDSFISTNFIPQANPVNKIINEDETNPSNLVVTLLGYDADPGDSLTYLITSLPTNGDIYASTDTTFTTPLGIGAIAGNQLLYKPDLNWNGVEYFNYKVNDGTDDSSLSTVAITVTPINDAPIFTSTPVAFTGNEGDTYTYNFTYEDIDHTDAEVIISTQSALPSGWTLTDNDDGTGVLTGPVPSGLSTIVLIATDPGGLTDSQTIQVSAAYDILSDMEFLVSYRDEDVDAGTGQSNKTSGSISMSGEPDVNQGYHSCSRAEFVLVAETLNSNNEVVKFRLGDVSLSNNTFSNKYKLKASEEDNRPANISNGTSVPASYLNLTSSGQVVDKSNLPVATYDANNKQSYYVDGTISSNDRHEYIVIPTSVIDAMTDPTNGTATGVFTLKLLPDSYELYDNGVLTNNTALADEGRLDTHADSAWLQVFKKNDAGTNQEEVTDSSGNSFSVTSASNVSINIFTGDVTVS